MMNIAEPLFSRAVAAIDSGNIAELENLITAHPGLVTSRLANAGDSAYYFKDPYLLWFVADNPIRTGKLPGNIAEITHRLINAIKQESAETYQFQIDYTLGLVMSGRTARDCGVQLALMDLLMDAGAIPDDGTEALANGNTTAAQHLLDRGGKLTLTAAVCLDRDDKIDQLAALASPEEKLIALTAAAFYGKSAMIKRLLSLGASPNGYPKPRSGFHSHATPLHQAVSSGSLEAVRLLVEAGATLGATDKAYGGTPLGWADYLQGEDARNEERKNNLGMIEKYLHQSMEAK
jgi:peptide-methionine (S)-S-oxide reductase